MGVTQRDAHLNRTGLWRLKQRVTKRISIDVSQKMLMASQFRIRNGNQCAYNKDRNKRPEDEPTAAKQCLSKSAHKIQPTSIAAP
jgi:hypothetical protein